MFNKSKSRKIAAVLALTGILIPISGWHKFYLGQPFWGVVYLLLSWTPIPHVASAMELVWYLVQDEDEFGRNFTLGEKGTAAPGIDPTQVSAIAEALRQLEQLRQDGLISEYEFEQKRRQWLDRMI